MQKYFSYIVVAVVLGLLALLAVLQYHRQVQVSAAEREKMQHEVTTNTSRFAEDFNREIQGAYFNFQLDLDEWKSSTVFNERFDAWTSKAAYPELVHDIYFAGSASDVLLKYDRDARSFSRSDWTPDLSDLQKRLSDPKNVRMIYEDKFAVAVPVHDAGKKFERIILKQTGQEPAVPRIVEIPEKIGDVILMLDPVVIKNRILPELANRYFADGSYRVSVGGKDSEPVFTTADPVTSTDASQPLLELSPDRFMFFARRGPAPEDVGEVHRGVVMNHRVESRTMSRVEEGSTDSNSVTIEMTRTDDSKPRTSIVTASRSNGDGVWTLNVQHTAGSIDNYINRQFRQNVAVGTGLFGLIAVAVLGIFFSAQRAKAFAQRQVDFVSSVSHEFRTPLAVIYSAGENLADGIAKDDDQVSRYGMLIKAEGRKLSGMVEQILEFAGARSGKQKYNIVSADASEIVRDAVDECSSVAAARGFVIDTDIAESLPIKADAGAISRAVQNLITNAVKYSDGSRQVLVTAANGGGSVRISVEDTGIGISESDLKQIFEPFYRSKDVVDAQIHGNGLGLSLVEQIVEAHGGTVRAESEVGKGSKFTIELPQS